jgi:hypothetical protein
VHPAPHVQAAKQPAKAAQPSPAALFSPFLSLSLLLSLSVPSIILFSRFPLSLSLSLSLFFFPPSSSSVLSYKFYLTLKYTPVYASPFVSLFNPSLINPINLINLIKSHLFQSPGQRCTCPSIHPSLRPSSIEIPAQLFVGATKQSSSGREINRANYGCCPYLPYLYHHHPHLIYAKTRTTNEHYLPKQSSHTLNDTPTLARQTISTIDLCRGLTD